MEQVEKKTRERERNNTCVQIKMSTERYSTSITFIF